MLLEDIGVPGMRGADGKSVISPALLSVLPYPVVRFSGPCWEVHGASQAAYDQLGVSSFAELSAAARTALEPVAAKIATSVWVGRGVLVVPWAYGGVIGEATVAAEPGGAWLLCLPNVASSRSCTAPGDMLLGEPLLRMLRLLPVPMWWSRRVDGAIGKNEYAHDLPRCQVSRGMVAPCTEAVIRAAGCGVRPGAPVPARLSFHISPEPGITATTQVVDLGRCGRWQVLTHHPRSGALAMVTMAFDEQRARNGLAATLAAREVVAQLSETEQLGREEVRAEVAREVHDNLGQELTLLRLALREFQGALTREDSASEGRWRPYLDRVVQQTDTIMSTARRIAYEQRVDNLTQKGLAAAATEYVLQVEARTGLRCSIEIAAGWEAPDQRMSRHLYRSIQELLNNVVKHAGAQRVCVQLAFAGNCYFLEVRDDGKGFELGEVDARAATHLGLRSLRERVAVYGGQLSVRSRPEVNGSAVRLYLPERRKTRREGSTIEGIFHPNRRETDNESLPG